MAALRYEVFQDNKPVGKVVIDTELWSIDTEDPEIFLQLTKLYRDYTTSVEALGNTNQKELVLETYPATPSKEKLNVLLDDLGEQGFVFTKL